MINDFYLAMDTQIQFMLHIFKCIRFSYTFYYYIEQKILLKFKEEKKLMLKEEYKRNFAAQKNIDGFCIY